MSLARDPSLQPLDDCGCCEGAGVETPSATRNRPGLGHVAYRVGTHASFRETLVAALSGGAGSVLRGLAAREQDFSVALLDAWAAVGDVLTFYQERIANESWVRTATERLSLIQLTRSIGYELRPGLAASTWLAFTLDEAPGSPEHLGIEPRTRVQSVPGPDELPQTFETLERLEARPAWNAMRPRTRRPLLPVIGLRELYLEGVTTGLRPGDPILIVGARRRRDPGNEEWDFRRLTEVEPDREAGVTRVAWTEGLGWRRFGREVHPASEAVRVYAFGEKIGVFGSNAPDWRVMPDSVKRAFMDPPPTGAGPVTEPEWPRFTLGEVRATAGGPPSSIPLDGLYPGVVPGSWVVLSVSAGPSDDEEDGPRNYEEVYEVTAVEEVALADFTLTSKSTRLDLRGENLEVFDEHLRELVVFAQSEPLELAQAPVRTPVEGDEIVLDGVVEGLEAGRTLLVRGRRARLRVGSEGRRLDLLAQEGGAIRRLEREEVLTALSVEDLPVTPPARRWRVRDERGEVGWVEARVDELFPWPSPADEEVAVERVTLEEAADDGLNTTLTLVDSLSNVFDRATTRVLGNVAEATHGESVAEVLGSGDASRPYQRFTLRDGPLTYVPAGGASGAESSLEVRVDDILWEEVPTLFGTAPRDRVYVVRHGEKDASVLFGDGRSGARPSSGRENVRALYRKGIGRTGNVRAGQLTLLMTRPLGLGGVSNPLPATGGTDPEQLEDARETAPLTVLTLDRIVSLKDYEDFARAFAGLAKAQAVWTWAGDARGVFLTVAGPEGDPVPEGGAVHGRLLEAIAGAAEALLPLEVRSYSPVRFRLSARVERHPAWLAERVHEAVGQALVTRFSFDERGFGEAVAASDVIATMQQVPGVSAVHLNALHPTSEPRSLNLLLQARAPAPGDDASAVEAAELLLLELAPDDIEVVP